MHPRHYAPRTPVILGAPPGEGCGAYLWLTRPLPAARAVAMPREAHAYAASLYATLHEVDAEKLDFIAIEFPPDEPAWEGVRDRLRRAAN